MIQLRTNKTAMNELQRVQAIKQMHNFNATRDIMQDVNAVLRLLYYMDD